MSTPSGSAPQAQGGESKSIQPGPVRAVLREAFIVGVLGAILAFSANGLSRRGLKLNRNYSPGGAVSSVRNLAATNGQTSAQLLAVQFQKEGLQLADSNLVARLYADPGRDSGLVIFVDARDDEHYQNGHIPGAYQLDHYHPENYLATILPATQIAQKVVVYCKGGSCEDSEQTAILLRDAGVGRDRLFVYAGGFDEWTANHMPIEQGDRNSGSMRPDATPSTSSEGAK